MSEKNLAGVKVTLQFLPETRDELEWTLRMLNSYADSLTVSFDDGSGSPDVIVESAEMVKLNLKGPAGLV